MIFPPKPIPFRVHVGMVRRIHKEKHCCVVQHWWVQVGVGAPGPILVREAHDETNHVKQVHHKEVKVGLAPQQLALWCLQFSN